MLPPNAFICDELPIASSIYRGVVAMVENGTTDEVYICRKVNGDYVWSNIDTGENLPGTAEGMEFTYNGSSAVIGAGIIGQMILGMG